MIRKISSFIFILVLSIFISQTVVADETLLPDAPWYAVTWERTSDTLHWVNINGEQARIQRPVWTDEAPNIDPRLHITANGRTLIQMVERTNGIQSLAFHDLETGQLLAFHEAQAGERFVWSVDHPSLLTGPRFAIGLTTPDVSQWRMITFDTDTGAAVAQLTVDDVWFDLPADTWFPYVLYYDLDEALNRLVVHFQMRTAAGDVTPFAWIPEGNNAGLEPAGWIVNPNDGYDIVQLTGFAAFGESDVENTPIHSITAVVGGAQAQVVDENGIISQPTWLNASSWIGYFYQDGVFAPHWRIGNAEANMTPMPIGPNFDMVYSTPDGLLARDGNTNELSHTTSIPIEGYSAIIGSIIYSPNTDYEVIYVTPWGANFNLPSVNGTGNGQPEAPAPTETAQPVLDCNGVLPSQMAIGMRGRVTFTDGASLRLRSEPNGAIIGDMAEGTEFDVIGGSLCVNGFVWWQIRLDDASIGWSAEANAEVYFMEEAPPVPDPTPFTPIPTLDGGGIVAPTTPTPVPTIGGLVVVPILPTATPMVFIAIPICTESPPSQLAVGDFAHTDTTGTLAMRVNLSDPTPTYQVPDNVSVTILEGPQCSSNGQRMWRVRATVNEQVVEGWVAEGWQDTYYLLPGLAILGG